MSISCRRYHLVLILCLKLLWILQSCIGEESMITVRIKENLSVGTVICHLFSLIIPRPSKHTVYSIIKNKYFAVNDYENVIVIGDIDRDSDSELCLERTKNHSCIWKSILLSSNSAHRVLKIIVEDENDNRPTWTNDIARIDITENVSPESFKLELPKAEDPDERPNNTVLYTVEPPSKFVFISNEVTANGLTPFLKLKLSIDREIMSWHNVSLLAIDGGNPPRTGSLFLLIKIGDINDNSPIFESSIYTHSLKKYTKVNERLNLNIKATDSDEGTNGNITYTFSLNSPFIIQSCLGIDPNTAVVIIKKPLTGQCLLPEYRFSLTASDQGNPIRSSKTNVLLTFHSQNLFAPDIQMSNKEPNIFVFENNPIGFLLRTIAVKDKDSGENGQFLCSIRGNNTGKISIISTMSSVGGITILQIVASSIFDREMETEILPTIVCKDFGKPSLSSSKSLVIGILDVNDNSPYFQKKSYHFKTYEENEPYQRLAQLSAFDKDEGYNAMLTYNIESTMNDDVTSKLTIDYHGYIISKEKLDREKFPNGFNFSVTATDQGRPPLKGSTDVFLELIDINDNNPIFKRHSYNFSFLEDIGSKHQSRIVGQVIAWDADLSNNSLVTYTISPVSPMPFKLNSESGQIYSYSLVDRDIQSVHYVFIVLAMDNPNNMLYRRTSAVSVSISISDYNDNQPAFLFPNEEHNRVQLSYLSPIGTVVATVKAVDKDLGLNSKIVYSLVDPDRNILFAINSSSGQLIISTVLNSIHEGVENLFIRASDCGTPPLTAIQRLVIEIGEYKLPLPIDADSTTSNSDPFLSDQATYIIVGIVLGTFFICCGLVTGICTMTYRQWRTSRIRRASSNRQCVSLEDPSQLQMYIDNYLEMKEMI